MAEQTDKKPEKARKPETATIVSRGGLGHRLKVKIEAAKVTDEAARRDPGDVNYKVPRAEWDKTLGPVLERTLTALLSRSSEKDAYADMYAGYTVMKYFDSGHSEYDSFHALASAFYAAAHPESMPQIDSANGYQVGVGKFLHALKDENAVLATKTQLEALINVAQGGREFAREIPKKDRSAQAEGIRAFYKTAIKDNPKFS